MMTCIVGIAEYGNVWIGGDSAGVSGYFSTPRLDPKVFKVGEFIFGFTSSFRMGQLLAHSLKVPDIPEGKDLYAYMVTDFVDAIRHCLKQGGYASKKDETESGGTFLVGYRGRLFCIEDDYQVGESMCGYDVCGCGREIAIGAMHATRGGNPSDRIRAALAAAEAYSSAVRAPFRILSSISNDGEER